MNLQQMQKLHDYQNGKLEVLTDDLKYKIHKKIIHQEYQDKVNSLKQKRRLSFQGKHLYNLYIISINSYFNKLLNLDWYQEYQTKKKKLKQIYLYEYNLRVSQSEKNQAKTEYLASLKLLKEEFAINKPKFQKETDVFLKSLFFEREEIIKNNDKNDLKKLCLEAKKIYHQKMALVSKKYKLANKGVKSAQYLTTIDGNIHRDFIRDIPQNKIKGLKKDYHLKQKEYKINCNSINQQQDDKFNSRIEKLTLKRPVLTAKSKFSYQGIFQLEKNELKITLLENIKILQLDYASKISASIYKLEECQNQPREEIKSQLKILRTEFFKNWILNWKQFFKHKMTFKMLKGLNRELNFNYFLNRKEIIFLDNKKQIKQEIKNLKFSKKSAIKHEKLLLNSNLVEISAKVPVTTLPIVKFLVAILGTIVPGLGDIINGQIIKGFWKLLGTGFAILLVLYAMGIGNIVGNGIFGLKDLGYNKFIWLQKDSRYFLIEGTISILFLAAVIVYCVLSGWSSFKVAKAKEMGGRTKTWLETKNYFHTVGYPIGTTVPAFVLVMFVIIVPIITTILIAFTNWTPTNSGNFEWKAGDAFKKIFTQEWAETMRNVVSWTLIWTFATWITSFLIAFVLALISNNERVKGKILFRLIYILPWAIPGFITILLFRLCFMPSGILSNIFNNDNFLYDGKYAKIAVLMIQMWSGYCVNFVLITGILQSISKDLYEAAAIDGASGFKKTLKVTVPLVIYQMTPILIGQFMACFNNFSIIYLYGEGGPVVPAWAMGAGATDTIASLVYSLVSKGNVAMASALNVLVSVVIVGVSVSVLLRSKAVKGGIN